MESTFQRAFAGGELAPGLAARADQVKYVTGLRSCRNFMVLRHGGVANRSGFRFIGESKTNATDTFLLRYVSETVGESILIEAGAHYLRFYKNGALVRLSGVTAYNGATAYVIGDIARSGGVNYWATAPGTGNAPPNAAFWYPMPSDILEILTPFGSGRFDWHQSGNVITLTSSLHQPHELIHDSLTHWTLQPVVTVPGIGPPTGLVLTPGPAGTESYSYRVTSAAVDSFEESTPGPIVQMNTVGPGTPATPHILNWVAPVGGPAAVEYYVYKDPYQNGVFGFLGTALGQTTFQDVGSPPDFLRTPPLSRVLFDTAGNFPRSSATYQQRRFFANTDNNPDAIWGSRIGFPHNFTISSPLQDDDAITFRIAASQHNPVRHLVGLRTLIVLTDAGEWNVGEYKIALTPSNIPADQETFVGVSATRPVVVGNSILYVQARGAIMRDLRFDQAVEGLAGRDLTLYATHLFDGFLIDRLDYQQTPHSIIWSVRSDGILLGLTYLREEEIWGWHRHQTGAAGKFEDVCVVPEAGFDAVYVLVRRTIGGVFKRYIERLEPREIFDYAVDSFFVDSGLTYSGVPATAISGLGHLEGEIVSVLADGIVIFNGDPTATNAANFRVSGGAIAPLAVPASTIHAGLPIQYAELETLDLDVQGASLRDLKKRVGSLSLLLEASARTFLAGPDSGHLRQVKLKPFEANQAGLAFTGQEELNLTPHYNNYGRVFLRHVDPLPLTILGLLPHVELGG